MRTIVIAAVLLAISMCILYNCPTRTPRSGKKWTVYGTMNCGWTVRQLDFMKKHGIAHEFVDCDSKGCAHEAHPTLVSPDGKEHVGYLEDL